MIIKCKSIVKAKGTVKAQALVFSKPFSFMGEVDMMTGIIIAKGHEHYGKSVAGKVLIYPEAKGSSGGCFVLRSLSSHCKTPAAIVNIANVDYNLVEGAILGNIPLLSKPDKDIMKLVKTGDMIEVNSSIGIIKIVSKK